MTLLLRMDDRMNRQLSCAILNTDSAMNLAEELVHYGFINEVIIHFIALYY
jgi:nuclear receptor-binding protein